jgi:hypothetical protein
MTEMMAAVLAIVLGAEIDVPAGAPLAPALAGARPGDVVRLGPGVHPGSLGRAAGLRVQGAGAGITVIAAPEGEDGAVAIGALQLSGLTLRAGPQRCALKVLGGEARLEDVALVGGACGAYLDRGRLSGRGVTLEGGYGLLAHGGDVALEEGSARGESAGIGVLGGTVTLRRFAVTGPSREAGISVAGGAASLEAVVVRSPGPAGISVSGGGRVEGVEVTIAGAVEGRGGVLGDCAQVIQGALRLEGATLARCAGAALESSRGEVRLDGVDASGGAAGCLVLVNDSAAELSGNLCVGRGPGLVVASRARARLVANRWWTDPVLWADCGAGVRVEVGRGEKLKTPCVTAP